MCSIRSQIQCLLPVPNVHGKTADLSTDLHADALGTGCYVAAVKLSDRPSVAWRLACSVDPALSALCPAPKPGLHGLEQTEVTVCCAVGKCQAGRGSEIWNSWLLRYGSGGEGVLCFVTFRGTRLLQGDTDVACLASVGSLSSWMLVHALQRANL